jgi:uncharacterized protein YjbI with pentapeptide repeats
MGFGNWSECKFEQADMRGCNAAQNNMTNADFNLAQCQGMVRRGIILLTPEAHAYLR